MQNVMSALTPKADMCSATRRVRFVPKADIDFVLGKYRCVATSGRTRNGDDDNRT